MRQLEDVEIRVREIEDGLVVGLGGEIDVARSPSLRHQIANLQIDRPPRLVVDFTAVSYIDSSVVATMVALLQTARRTNSLMILCALSERVRGVFELTRLDSGAFTIVETVEEALAIPHRRKDDRFHAETLRCNRGVVLDLSASGVRLRTKRCPKGVIRLRIRNDAIDVTLDARVAWTQRLGFRRYEVGLRFVDLESKAALEIAALVDRTRERSTRRRDPVV